MTWKVVKAVEQRKELIERLEEGETVARLAREYGVSRTTVYCWQRRHREAPEEGLEARSRRPHHSPQRTGEEQREAILRSAGGRAQGDSLIRPLRLCMKTSAFVIAAPEWCSSRCSHAK